MRVLIACEFSEIVKEQFLLRGHDAHSCDFLPREKGLPNHHQCDVLTILDDGWDLMIAFPPCTHLAVSGARYFAAKRADGRQQEAIAFFLALAHAPIVRIAIENPVGVMSSIWRKPDQIIQPYEFGEDASKATCLWLKGLPKLKSTKYIEPHYRCRCGGLPFEYALGKYGCPNCNGEYIARLAWGNQTPSGQNKLGPSDHRKADRSRTYKGVAEAMASQWGN